MPTIRPHLLIGKRPADRNTTRPMARRVLSMLLAIGFLGALTTGCESNPEERDLVIALVNQSRASNGRGVLRMNEKLNMKADAWAIRLRDSCNLSHSRLSDGAPKEWLKLGENVGYGGSIEQVHEAYLNSPGHKANIMDPSFNYMGAAAVWGDCEGQHRVFTVQVFMKA